MKVAVVGAGISGMGCAWALSKTHDVLLIEKEARIGGHSRTVNIAGNNVVAKESGLTENKSAANTSVSHSVTHGEIPVDTGFIVFNKKNYPNLTALFDHLEVPIKESSMSFGISQNDGDFEYGTANLKSIFGQPANILKPRFWRMILGILKFNRLSKAFLANPEAITLEQFLNDSDVGEEFQSLYLLPMAASIWSCPKETMLAYPASSLLKFFDNHGLLSLFDQPQWFTVDGGSQQYIDRLMADFRGELKVDVDIRGINRNQDNAEIQFRDGSRELFDRIVFACHADQSLSLIGDTTEVEREILGSFKFQSNHIVTHSDTSFMPKRRACWSSWSYIDDSANQGVASLSYWMNRLQSFLSPEPILVTMNPITDPSDSSVYDDWQTTHPVFDKRAITAQSRIDEIQGKNNLYFCGAWTGYGFHEDGLRSGLKVAEQMGAQIPWVTGPQGVAENTGIEENAGVDLNVESDHAAS